jgi:transcriptional regulator with AAA-type ATPase domain/tetratricopeptide (TPR) repeat protein
MTSLTELIGEHPGIAVVRDTVQRVVERASAGGTLPPVLIQGETGTGKGLLARAIHRASPRAERPFVAVNCAAIPPTLLEAELFGFERGAFTDARQAKPGLFQAAHRGTLFLDEIAELPPSLQPKLLKVIEDREVRRLGSTRSEPVDVWILAATSEVLGTPGAHRTFNEPLYHRLSVLTFRLPPLREREGDIVRLAEAFLVKACAEYGLPPKTFASDARAALLAYRWPGNVRELANLIERVTLLTDAATIGAEQLALPSDASPAMGADGATERARLLDALLNTGWNVTHAAERLGLSRNTLRYRIQLYDLRPEAERRRRRRRSPPPAGPAPRPPAKTPVEAPPAPAASVLRWEHRLLTLLRANLLGPDPALPRPDVRPVLDRLLAKTESFGGRVEALSPASLTAVFGLDEVEQAPARAALAAMAVQREAERLREQEGGDWRVKAALHTGHFLVGRGRGAPVLDESARHEAGAVLATVVDGAEPGTTRVSEATSRLLARGFEFVSAGGSTYRLVARRPSILGAAAPLTPFVGRRHELELLTQHLAEARARRGQVVGIAGEPGLGKSRLVLELRQALARHDVAWVEGSCRPDGAAVPYFPLRELLRHHAGMEDGDPPEAITARLRAALEPAAMAPAHALPFLLHLVGIRGGAEILADLSPEVVRSRLFAALRDLLLGASRQRPLVVVVENLHWIDRASESWLTTFVEHLPGAQVLLVTTYRPGYAPPWLERSYAAQLALTPLGIEDSLRVVRSVAPANALSDVLAQRIVTKADGNPFFLEELALASRTAEAGDPAIPVPDTIDGILTARIDRLPDEARRLLQAASVLGRVVPLGLLGELDAGTPEHHLPELVRLEFLSAQHTASEPTYTFRHALTQEVAYASLTADDRATLHAAAGRGLERQYADRLDEVCDRLAYHYARSGETGKAIEFLVRTAQRATQAYALPEAIDALRHALRLTERLPEPERDRRGLELSVALALPLTLQADFGQVRDLLVTQRPRLARVHDPALAGRYHFRLGITQLYGRQFSDCVASADRALIEAARAGDELTLGQARYLLAFHAFWTRPAEGVAHAREAIARLRRIRQTYWVGLAYWILARNLGVLGQFAEALDAAARAETIGDSLPDPRLVCLGGTTGAWIGATRGHADAAVARCTRAREEALTPIDVAAALHGLGFAHLARGEAAGAVQALEQALKLLRDVDMLLAEGRITASLGEAYLMAGDVERARALASESMRLTQTDPYGHGLARRVGALTGLARRAPAEAESHAVEALRLFDSVGSRFESARAHRLLGEIAAHRGDGEPAAAHLSTALERFLELDVPHHVQELRRIATEHGIPIP